MDTTLASRASERLADSATARAIAWLTAWDSQGVHRTATVGDEAGAHWLIREASSLGAAPAVETFALDRLDPIDAYLEFDGTRVPGVPVFDAPATAADDVVGILGPVARQRPSPSPSCHHGVFTLRTTKSCIATRCIADWSSSARVPGRALGC